MSQGPLTGLRVIEVAGLGTVPFAAMLFGDLGAEVVRIDRPGDAASPNPIASRNRTSVVLDLKNEAGREAALDAMACADVLIIVPEWVINLSEGDEVEVMILP